MSDSAKGQTSGLPIWVTLCDGDRWQAKFVCIDLNYDLAVIKIDIRDRKLPVIWMGSSGDLEVGQKVFGIGNPFGLGQTLTTEVISSLGGNIRTDTETGWRRDEVVLHGRPRISAWSYELYD